MGEQYQQYRLERIVELVSRRMVVDRKAIFGKCRTATVALARQVCMALARSLLKLSLEATGKHFNRDHTTVIHAETSIMARQETDKGFGALFLGMQAELADEFSNALNRDVALCELSAHDRNFCQSIANILADPKQVLASGLRRRVFSLGYGKGGEPVIVGSQKHET